ncbi:PREDICTED: uncharacterized protein LOC108972527 [Bactrocera latifrons]|nr:PREDICTED: uncharacterized protein LOC108972527 [Bactrocera latifrons]
MTLYSEYHYDDDCGVAKFYMRLSGWVFNAFALAELPKGYVENGDFGPRVAKYDWFELLAKFPLLIVLLVIAVLTTLFWLIWLCCTVRGLQKSAKKRHRCCLYFTTFLLLLLLLPLAIGLYLTFRTNFLLRRSKDDSKSFGDTARSALVDEDANFMNQAEYKANPTQLSIKINKVITEELADWLQTIAQTEQKSFEKLKYLNSNGDFYSTALQSLRDYAYELVILGIEMNDLLRTVGREAFAFLQANVKNTTLIESKMLRREHINVWHLNSVYTQYSHSYEYLEYLLKAYENISLLQKSIAESTPTADMSENDLFVTPTLRQLPKPYMNDRSSTEHPQILNPILYLAMTMFFLTAALAYIFLMGLGFGICRYYARANCMLKIFLFLNILAIPVLAFLTVLHFLPAMVLHTGICHENDLRGSSYRIPQSWRCDPVNNINADEAYDYEMAKIKRMLPKITINHNNYSTNNHQVVMEFPQEKWYESDVQDVITEENYTSYAGYIKDNNKENTTGANIFSCKINSILKSVRTDLYDKIFAPNAAELYEVLTKLKKRTQPKGYDNFTKHLTAQAEIVAPKVIQKGERSILGKLSVKIIDLLPLIQKMQAELHNLIADVMQLSDHTRFFYRNTTALLDLQSINFNDYSALLFNEFEANEQQIVMLLNINNALVKFLELVLFASTLNDMRENLTTNMYTEFDMLGKDLNATVTRKTLEYASLDEKKFAQLASIHRGTGTNADFFLSPNLSHLEAVYGIVATLILALLFVYLGDFVIGARNRTITRYFLTSIIITISVSLLLLCVFAIWHFLHGVVYYNYHREINENEDFCNATQFHYCSLHNQVRSSGSAQDNLRLSLTSCSINDLCSSIYDYNNKRETQLWTQELNQQLPFFEQIFRSGAMFEVARQELNLENWYELYNTLHNYNLAESNSELSNNQQKMLACNLHTIREYIFEQLFKRNIVASIFKLTQQSGTLRTHLPGNNLTRLIKRVLREAEELSDFCHTLENLLQEKIGNISELLARELISQVAPLFEQFPRCEDLRFASLGVSREMYECIECSLHSFHIGAFGILIILFIVLLLCICLVMLYEKQAAIGVIRSSSLLGMRLREYAASDNSPGSWANQVDSGGRKVFVKRPTRVRFIEPPKIKRRRRR